MNDKPTWFCGVDPGITGAVAFYTEEPIEQLYVMDFPTDKKKFHTHLSRQRIDETKAAQMIKEHIEMNGPIKLALIEDVHAISNDGGVSAFNFGKATGIIEGILGCLDIPIIRTDPGVWKSQLGLSSVKSKSLKLAVETFKNISGAHNYFSLVKDHGKAEAALLAKLAYSKFGGGK